MSEDKNKSKTSNEPNPSRVKLPEFIETNPSQWLAICESIFRTHRIDNREDKFNIIVAYLPAKVNNRLQDILFAEAGSNKLTLLKNRLEALYGLQDHERYAQLMAVSSLSSNQRPSMLLATMLSLLPAKVEPDGFMFRHCFLSKLPSNVRALCNAQKDFTLDQLASYADTVTDMQSPSSSPLCGYVGAVEGCPAAAPCNVVQAACQAVTVTPPPAAQSSTLCFYHRQFRDKARKCEPNCSWSVWKNEQRLHWNNTETKPTLPAKETSEYSE